MSPSVGRLKKRSEFLKVAAARRKWATPGLILQARPREPDEQARGDTHPEAECRVGYTVSRKVGNAVRRNRARRRLRAAAAKVLPACGRPGYDYVVIGRQGTPERPFAALLADLRTALKEVSRERRPGARQGRNHRPQ